MVVAVGYYMVVALLLFISALYAVGVITRVRHIMKNSAITEDPVDVLLDVIVNGR
jgi:hypothetical protein